VVLNRLRDEQIADGKQAQFEILQRFLSVDRASANYAEAAQQLDMTEGATRVAAHRLRKHYRSLLRDEIANTVLCEADIEDEIRHLFEGSIELRIASGRVTELAAAHPD